MSSTSRRPYPEAVPGWMVGDQRARVLDVGCGNGAFAEMLHERGHEVFAIDRHLDAVAVLPERLGTRCTSSAKWSRCPIVRVTSMWSRPPSRCTASHRAWR